MKNQFAVLLASISAVVLIQAVLGQQKERTPEIDQFEKIDCHVHFRYTGRELADLAKEMRFRVINISTNNFDIAWQAGLARRQRALAPGTVEHVTAFTMKGFTEPWWTEAITKQLDQSFDDDGAIGVKIWKDVGMHYRGPNGQYILIDDERFTPVFEHLTKRGVTVVLHIADPIEYWREPKEIASPGRRRIIENQGLYVMSGKSNVPSHAELVAARDRVLARHPNLKVVGAHLGSLEHDLEALGRTLDKHPNFAVDTAARMRDLLQYEPEVLKAFLLKYQDRILYGTDMSLKPNHSGENKQKLLRQRWENDWAILAGTEKVETKSILGEVSYEGLGLPFEVLEKIYRENALAWFEGLSSTE